MNTPRFDYLDAYKLIAIIGVLFAHLPPTRGFDSLAWSFVQLIQQITGWCVLAFFISSGTLFNTGIERPIGMELSRRSRRLLIPWFSFTFLYQIIVSILVMLGIMKPIVSVVSGENRLLLLFTHPVNPQLYYLLCLFFFQALLLLLHRFSLPLLFLAGIAAFIAWLFFLSYNSSKLLHGPLLGHIPLYFSFIVFGFYCGNSLKRIAIAFFFFGFSSFIIILLRSDFLIAFQLVTPWSLLLFLRSLEGRVFLRGLAMLGRFSSKIFVWHAPIVIALVCIIVRYLFGPGLISVLLSIAGTFVLSALLGVFVNRSPRLCWWHM